MRLWIEGELSFGSLLVSAGLPCKVRTGPSCIGTAFWVALVCWFPTKLLYQAHHLGSNKYWSTSKRTRQVHNQFKDSSCICFCLLSLDLRLNIFFWLVFFFLQLPTWMLRNLYLHGSILLLCNVPGSSTSIAHSGFLNRIFHVSKIKIDLSVNRTVGQRYSFPCWTYMDIFTCMRCS